MRKDWRELARNKQAVAPLVISPMLVASITASSSFVGEKERRTIEGLLYTPITDRELVLVLVSGVPSVPLVALLATRLIVAISGRSTTVQGAQGSAVLIILPVVALVVGRSTTG